MDVVCPRDKFQPTHIRGYGAWIIVDTDLDSPWDMEGHQYTPVSVIQKGAHVTY